MELLNKQRIAIIILGMALCSCSVQKKMGRSAQEYMLSQPAFATAHTGISIYDAGERKYLYNYQGDKYFVPASNTKIPTVYAGMKYLGDSLVGAYITRDTENGLVVFPAGDPTFLHSDYKRQPVYEKLKGIKSIYWDLSSWQTQRWGNGWSWNDYDAYYMAERSPFPVYGNVVRFSLTGNQLKRAVDIRISSDYPDSAIRFSPTNESVNSRNFRIQRQLDGNEFILKSSGTVFQNADIPFRTEAKFISQLLLDTLKAERVVDAYIPTSKNLRAVAIPIYSQPTDSMLKPLMYRSDNFFAEQTLLMVSEKLFGVMNENKVIDTLLATDFKDLPQKPRWADGSGLSRYNLFTPQDFVSILEKMKDAFGMPRIQNILATGNTGTLRNYYVSDSSFIYAKTGTLSGVVALSGFLITQKNKLLIFSVLVNNHQVTSTDIRRGVEKFIQQIRRDY